MQMILIAAIANVTQRSVASILWAESLVNLNAERKTKVKKLENIWNNAIKMDWH